jgi:hypothetical protein
VVDVRIPKRLIANMWLIVNVGAGPPRTSRR